MKKIFPLFTFLFLAFAINTFAQKAPAEFKISNIKIVPFEQTSGEFAEELSAANQRSFFNDLGTALFVTVEISGKAGDYEGKRSLEVTVLEGKKVKLKKVLMSGILNENGKFYFPVFLEAPMCDEITIIAKIIGQKTPSTMKKKVSFLCGE
ncbi:MAG TPA: hypothetical protein PKY59_18540 [Pyrinomonadaceae bacterium]|nr:hypothetical protein [Pyrinomonadaceae bacterium]